MKNKMQLEKQISLILIIVLFSINSLGQEVQTNNRWNFKAGYSRAKTNKSITTENGLKRVSVGNYQVEANYSFSKLIDAGVYFGYSRFETNNVNWTDLIVYTKYSYTPFYGVNCVFHILPLLVKTDSRFDLYITGKLGGLSIISPEGYYPHGQSTEYGLGSGFSFYLTKNLGLYAEYCYGKYYFKDDSKLRYGLTLKF